VPELEVEVDAPVGVEPPSGVEAPVAIVALAAPPSAAKLGVSAGFGAPPHPIATIAPTTTEARAFIPRL